MDRSKRLYAKALKIYNHGYIYNAISLCDKSTSLDVRNIAALNLKGLLYYLNGDLDRAQKTWKLNSHVNKDKVAKKYLEDSKKDELNLERYMNAVNLVKNLKINEALELLKVCSESDYNYINVNNYKTICYIKKAEYTKAQECIDKVFRLDKNNSTAKNNMKMLVEYGVVEKKHSLKRAGMAAGIFMLIIILLALVFFAVKSFTNRNMAKLSNNKSSSSASNIKKSTPEKKKTAVSKKQETFPKESLNTYIDNKNFDAMYDCVIKWKDKSLSVNDKALISSAEQMLSSDEGVQYFYTNGCNFINNKDYSKANDSLLKAYQFGSQSYLYSHIIYMLGLSYNSSKDVENAIKYFEKYDQNFPSGDYEETVLYNLAVIYKDIDKTKAKTYANKLADNYSSSMYNNSLIQSIINW
ncbi:tetratricopeptide repeat protein [Clostridium sp. JN-1]|uniref:tetratricopeptide repeat protein n=1 Tax=Clostridium sp. JN-1 TaxID=2483110 RepID=UPI000F0B23EA|nr:tetratricopeptide repeat protein [Clostridium sp. JN-1]